MLVAEREPTVAPAQIAHFAGESVEIGRKIGEGAFGAVYKTPAGALKVQSIVGKMVVEGPFGLDEPGIWQYQTVRLDRLQPASINHEREAWILQQIGHDRHIVDLYNAAVGDFDPTVYYMHMRYYQDTLAGDIWSSHESGIFPYTPRDAVRGISQLALALDRTHRAGFIHRDVKPENILIGPDGELALGDYGVAVADDEQQVPMGTREYAAPEQWAGHAVPSSDDFALAVVAYEMLTGERAFRVVPELSLWNHSQVLPRRVPGQMPLTFEEATGRPQSAQMKAMERVIMAQLSPNPEERYVDAVAFAAALENAAYLSLLTPGASAADRARAAQLYPEAAKRAEVKERLAVAAQQRQVGDAEGALQTLQEAHELDPTHIGTLDLIARIADEKGWREVTNDVAAKIIRFPARHNQDLAMQSAAHRYFGHREEADRLIYQAEKRDWAVRMSQYRHGHQAA